MQTLRVPKRVPIDVMRLVLGDQRTEDFLTAAYGPKLLGPVNIRVNKEAAERMLAHLEGRIIEGQRPTSYQQAIPAIFRLYFREAPKAKNRLVLWLKAKLAEAGESDVIAASEISLGAAQIREDVQSKTVTHKRITKASKTTRKRKVGANGR